MIAFLFSPHAFAGIEIVFNKKGEQISRSFPGGVNVEVSADHEVVWDSRKHGPLPKDAPLGYAERFEVQEQRTQIERRPVVDVHGKPVLGEDLKPIMEDVEVVYHEKVAKLRENAAMKAAYLEREAKKNADKAAREASDAECADLRKRFKEKKNSAADLERAVSCLLR